MSSLFDSFFGFIFWGVAYFRMRRVDGSLSFTQDRSFRGLFEGVLNIVSPLHICTCLNAWTKADLAQDHHHHWTLLPHGRNLRLS